MTIEQEKQQKKSLLSSPTGFVHLFVGQSPLVSSEERSNLTRPDTRPIPVADGWAGAEMRVFTLFDLCSWTDRRTDGWTNRRTDRRTDGPTDGRTKPLIELRVRN